MKIVILDASLSDYGSHGFNYCKAITKTISAMGFSYRLFANIGVDEKITADISAIPHFRRSIYEGITANHDLWQLSSWDELNSAYYADLESIPISVWNSENLILFPAVNQNQFLAICRWISKLDFDRAPRIVVQLMFYPTWTAWGWEASLGPSLYKHAFNEIDIQSRGRVALCSENRETAQVYERLLNVNVNVLPVPSARPLLTKTKLGIKSDILYVGIFGYSKFEKGFHLVPEMISFCKLKGLSVRFVVQVLHGGWEAEVQSAEDALARFGDVILVRGALDPDKYYPLLEFCDVIALPYDPDKYKERGSSVFSESVIYAKPIVACEGTWMSSAASRNECSAVIFSGYNAREFADAVIQAVDQFSKLKSRAELVAADWFQRNNGVAYCEALFGACGLVAPSINLAGLEANNHDQYPIYEGDRWIEFGTDAEQLAAFGEGWSRSEPRWRWMEGTTAKIYLRPMLASAVTKFCIWASIPDGVADQGVSSQIIGVWINEFHIGDFSPSPTAKQFELPVPDHALIFGFPTVIELRAASIFKVLGDSRELSCCVHSLCFQLL